MLNQMSYQLPRVNVRVFTGDDIIDDDNIDSNDKKRSTNSEYNEASSVDQAINVAFVNKVKSLVSGSEVQL